MRDEEPHSPAAAMTASLPRVVAHGRDLRERFFVVIPVVVALAGAVVGGTLGGLLTASVVGSVSGFFAFTFGIRPPTLQVVEVWLDEERRCLRLGDGRARSERAIGAVRMFRHRDVGEQATIAWVLRVGLQRLLLDDVAAGAALAEQLGRHGARIDERLGWPAGAPRPGLAAVQPTSTHEGWRWDAGDRGGGGDHGGGGGDYGGGGGDG